MKLDRRRKKDFDWRQVVKVKETGNWVDMFSVLVERMERF